MSEQSNLDRLLNANFYSRRQIAELRRRASESVDRVTIPITPVAVPFAVRSITFSNNNHNSTGMLTVTHVPTNRVICRAAIAPFQSGEIVFPVPPLYVSGLEEISVSSPIGCSYTLFSDDYRQLYREPPEPTVFDRDTAQRAARSLQENAYHSYVLGRDDGWFQTYRSPYETEEYDEPIYDTNGRQVGTRKKHRLRRIRAEVSIS